MNPPQARRQVPPDLDVSRSELVAALPAGLLGALIFAAFVAGLALFGPS